MRAIRSIGQGFSDLFSLSGAFLILMPPIVSAMGWITALIFLQQPLWDLISSLIASWNPTQDLSQSHVFGVTALQVLYWALMLPVLFLLVWISSALIVNLFAVPWIKTTLKKKYPLVLGGASTGSISSTLRNFVKVLGQAFLLFLVTLLFAWIPGVWAVGLITVAAWMNARLLFLEISAEIRQKKSAQEVWQEHRVQLIGMSFFFALMFSVPLLGLLVPVWTALSFFHYLCQKAEAP